MNAEMGKIFIFLLRFSNVVKVESVADQFNIIINLSLPRQNTGQSLKKEDCTLETHLWGEYEGGGGGETYQWGEYEGGGGGETYQCNYLYSKNTCG